MLACLSADAVADQFRHNPKVVEHDPRITHYDGNKCDESIVYVQDLEALVASHARSTRNLPAATGCTVKPMTVCRTRELTPIFQFWWNSGNAARIDSHGVLGDSMGARQTRHLLPAARPQGKTPACSV